MREVGLLRTEVVGNSLLCNWNDRDPATRKLTALLESSERSEANQPSWEAVYASLKSWGAGLAKGRAARNPLKLEETLAYGVLLARRDPDVAEIWPVVLAKHRTDVNRERLEILGRRLGQKRALGFLLTLTGILLKDSTLPAFAGRLRDSRVRRTQDFFTLPRGKRMGVLTRTNTPDLARDWFFQMNTSLASFQHHFDKFMESE